MSKANHQISLNAEELKNFMHHIIANNKTIQEKGVTPVCVNVEGPAGIGKTSSIVQLAQELNMDIVRLNLAELEDLSDLVGFPLKEYEIVNEDKVSKWVPETLLPQYIASKYKPTGNKRMSYAAPEWINNKKEGGILILDDYTRADARFMQATMTLIETQTYYSWCLPKNWHIILTTNPDDGNYNVTSLDSAQKTRFITVNFKFDVDVWARWAEKQDIDTRCINFLLLHPELVKDDTNPRSIMTFFNSISSIPEFKNELPLIQMIGEGSVGVEFSTMFTTFINNRLDKLVTPKDVLLHENEAYIIGELRNCIGRDDNYRADIASILTTRIINYTINYSETNSITKKIIDRLIKLSTDEDTLTNDLKYIIVKKILNANKQKFQGMMLNPEVIKMAMK
jgi:hypothetical protein